MVTRAGTAGNGVGCVHEYTYLALLPLNQRSPSFWHQGPEFAQTAGDSEGQGSLVCSATWGRKESGTTE